MTQSKNNDVKNVGESLQYQWDYVKEHLKTTNEILAWVCITNEATHAINQISLGPVTSSISPDEAYGTVAGVLLLTDIANTDYRIQLPSFVVGNLSQMLAAQCLIIEEQTVAWTHVGLMNPHFRKELCDVPAI